MSPEVLLLPCLYAAIVSAAGALVATRLSPHAAGQAQWTWPAIIIGVAVGIGAWPAWRAPGFFPMEQGGLVIACAAVAVPVLVSWIKPCSRTSFIASIVAVLLLWLSFWFTYPLQIQGSFKWAISIGAALLIPVTTWSMARIDEGHHWRATIAWAAMAFAAIPLALSFDSITHMSMVSVSACAIGAAAIAAPFLKGRFLAAPLPLLATMLLALPLTNALLRDANFADAEGWQQAVRIGAPILWTLASLPWAIAILFNASTQIQRLCIALSAALLAVVIAGSLASYFHVPEKPEATESDEESSFYGF